jgi:hypothetical protein
MNLSFPIKMLTLKLFSYEFRFKYILGNLSHTKTKKVADRFKAKINRTSFTTSILTELPETTVDES